MGLEKAARNFGKRGGGLTFRPGERDKLIRGLPAVLHNQEQRAAHGLNVEPHDRNEVVPSQNVDDLGVFEQLLEQGRSEREFRVGNAVNQNVDIALAEILSQADNARGALSQYELNPVPVGKDAPDSVSRWIDLTLGQICAGSGK